MYKTTTTNEMLAILNKYGRVSDEQIVSEWGSQPWMYRLGRFSSRGFTRLHATDALYQTICLQVSSQVHKIELDRKRAK